MHSFSKKKKKEKKTTFSSILRSEFVVMATALTLSHLSQVSPFLKPPQAGTSSNIHALFLLLALSALE